MKRKRLQVGRTNFRKPLYYAAVCLAGLQAGKFLTHVLSRISRKTWDLLVGEEERDTDLTPRNPGESKIQRFFSSSPIETASKAQLIIQGQVWGNKYREHGKWLRQLPVEGLVEPLPCQRNSIDPTGESAAS